MLITVYRATEAKDVPEELVWAMDEVDDRYVGAHKKAPALPPEPLSVIG